MSPTRRKDIVAFAIAKGNPTLGCYGSCETCAHYGKSVVCGRCYSGSRYVFSWKEYLEDNKEEFSDWLRQKTG